MAKQAGASGGKSLKDKLAALIQEERARMAARRDELKEKRMKLQGELAKVDRELEQLNAELASQVKDALKESGVRLESSGAKRGRPRTAEGGPREPRGKNQNWIVTQLGKKQPQTRAEIMDKAESAGLKPLSISQALQSMTEQGLLERIKEGRTASYMLPK